MQGTPVASLSSLFPWTDRAGRLVLLKLVCMLALCAPAVWMIYEWAFDLLSPKPVTDLIRESGDWALRILVLSLAVTPLRYVARWNRVAIIRRMVGLAALFYTLAHIVLWCIDLQFDWLQLAMELVLRMFLTVGLAGTLIMVVLGLTSNDFSIRHLGAQRWNSLHAWVYASVALSVLHYFMEVRLDATEAALMCGFFILLMAFRVVRRRVTPRFVNLTAMAVLCGLATAIAEAIYYRVSTGVDINRVLLANFDFSYTIRPSWWVLGVGVLVAILAEVRARFAPARGRDTLRRAAAGSASAVAE